MKPNLGKSEHFRLDPRLEADSVSVCRLQLSELRILNDRRWPWLLVIPHSHGAVEIHDLEESEQTVLASETAFAARVLARLTHCNKINSGALGNIVRQLHVHVIARNEGDPNWPGPVWGFEERIPYHPDEMRDFRQELLASLRELKSEL